MRGCWSRAYRASFSSLSDGSPRSVGTLSVDLFDTLLKRPIRHDTLLSICDFAGIVSPARPDQATILSILSRVKAELSYTWLASGRDPEIPRHLIINEVLRKLWGRPATPEEVDQFCELELTLLCRATYLDQTVVDLIQQHRRTGVRVVVTSDTHFSARDIEFVLRHHGLTEIDHIYSSSDCGKSKFHGRLFDHVIREESIDAERLIHVGDNWLSDVWSARAQGVRSSHFSPAMGCVTRDGRSRTLAAGYGLGFTTLGPIFAAFAELLLQAARQDKVKRLGFLARDGDLLFRLTSILADSGRCRFHPQLCYLHLSRRSTALIARPVLDENDVAEALSVRASGSSARRVLGYFNIPAEIAEPFLAKYDLGGGDARDEGLRLRSLLADASFTAATSAESDRQRALLHSYLKQEGFTEENSALVDVGWRCSIQRTLDAAFGRHQDYSPSLGYYFGIWNEVSAAPPPRRAIGLISDMRRARTTREGAAWYVAHLLEAICRADEGTTIGYQRSPTGGIVPVLAGDNVGRRAETSSSELCSGIRRGITDYVREYAQRSSGLITDEGAWRADMQRRLHRLAFFPTEEEILIGESLFQTEGHIDSWSTPLIERSRSNPISAPRRWLSGLGSPWRSGYVKATGGASLARVFIAVESALLALPPSIRARWRRAALRISRPA